MDGEERIKVNGEHDVNVVHVGKNEDNANKNH